MNHLLRDLRHMVEADGGSAFSPGALDGLRELVEAAMGTRPSDCSGLEPLVAFHLGELHAEWSELRAWLETVTSDAAQVP